MAVTAVVYNNYKLKQIDNSTKIALGTDTIKVALVGAGYTPDIDTHDFWDDVSANESSGTGYTAGGATLANPAVSIVTASDLAKFDADDVTWTISSSLSARYAVVYKSTGTGSTSPLILYFDLGSTYALSSGTLTLTFSASGILTLT
jgi:hypothetical protein